MKLNLKAFALTCALVWGFGLMILTWWIMIFQGQADTSAAGYTPPFIGLVYRGYHFTFAGSLIGFVWAFVDGLIGGVVFAWVYNFLAGRKNPEAASL